MEKTFYFIDNETGEEFFVQAPDARHAIDSAAYYYEEPQLLREVSDYEAEMMGLDTY